MSPATTSAWIGLGSNLDDPRRQLDRALQALAREPDITLQQVSSYYRTAPWGVTDQPHFVNAVARLDTRLSPLALLDVLRRLEHQAGRERLERWGPRVLDLDLLLFGETCCDTAQLQLPHPRMHERAFVLVPLAELEPGLVLGRHGSVSGLLARIGRQGVEVLPEAPPSGEQ